MKILLSGGADGSDLLFENLALLNNMQVFAYSFQGHSSKSRARYIVDIDILRNKWKEVKTIAEAYRLGLPANAYIAKLITRNIFQINGHTEGIKSQLVVAVAKVFQSTTTKATVDGGTKWAVYYATLKMEPSQIIIYDMISNKFYSDVEYNCKYHCVNYRETNPADVADKLKRSDVVTGIGSRQITPTAAEAIKRLFRQSGHKYITK